MTSLSTSTPSQSKMTRSRFILLLDAFSSREPVSTPHQVWGRLSLEERYGWESARSILVVVERNAIELEPVIDQAIAELAGDLGLQLLDLLRGEFDHLAVAQIDQMIVMAVAHLLVARAPFAEIVSLDDAGILEQFDGAIHRRDRDLVIDRRAAAIQFLDIRVIVRFRQHARNHAALLGHAHAGGGAARLDAGRLGRRRWRGGRFQCGHGAGPERDGVFLPSPISYDKSRRIRSAFSCSPPACW